MKEKLLAAAFVSPMMIAAPAFAENVPDTYGYIGANASHYFFYDNEAFGEDVDGGEDNWFYGGQLGWRFNPNWSIQAWYEESDGDVESDYDSGARWDVQSYFASLRYHMNGTSFLGFEPYAGFNMGDLVLESLNDNATGDKGDKQHAFMTGVEVGIQRAFADRILLDLGTRQAYAADRDFWTGQVYAAVNVLFGVSTAHAAPEPEPEPVIGDQDGDGVPDDRDACPDTPAGAVVDERGCQKYGMVSDQSMNVIYFGFDKADIGAQFNDEVRQAADNLNKGESGSIRVEGHADSTGPENYNQGLSERRAQAVKDRLIRDFQVDSSKITTKGFGETRPAESNDTREGRAKNRRAEIFVDTEQAEPQFKE
ncbi:outer membrane protein OprF [Alcanivorax xiamenensis]|uniref:Outer membrane protein OprF n=1 Tax=Alcanivorax xiamenensis TaxID=1177156 RepID=A0ABQ6YAC3_9GAMM|nr:OmpA family protein [Alcanivorax xiamenensis]KAF0806772.1 outer membrane protein OprF [Alcanivorax xiamenensis]